ncbi:LysR family transcriptional regulator [Novosphingobium sp. UBA1939]|uniref:LysR family transcriptional regulator n=1 Tax=Novosphingobium sp. UBA1939 TaxID=1946982 RepID=UPI002600C822|nr:LysR family transcriptional regulator [Novosphingobium sp. UBA1939]
MIKRNHIRQFLALADAGSFVAAAARLHVTQPTLSTGIAELERLVGAQLFLRDRRHIRLTEVGGAFLPIARDLERGFRAADNFGRSAAVAWPSLRLGVIRSIASHQLHTIVEALGREHGIEMIEGTDYELRTALASGRIHLALTLLRDSESGGESGLAVHPLWEEPYTMLVAQSHPLAGRASVAPEELAGEIMIARRSCEILEETSRFFTGAGVRPRFALRSPSDERCLAMVAAGLGITTAPASLAVAGTVPLAVEGYDFRRRIGFLHDPSWGEAARDALAQVASLFADGLTLGTCARRAP